MSQLGRGGAELGSVTLVGDDQLRVGSLQPQTQVLGPQLFVARQHDGADPEAGDHRQHPLGPVADQRHDHVTAFCTASLEGRRQPGRAVCELAEGPFAAVALARELDQRAAAGRLLVEDVAGEVHRRGMFPGRVF